MCHMRRERAFFGNRCRSVPPRTRVSADRSSRQSQTRCLLARIDRRTVAPCQDPMESYSIGGSRRGGRVSEPTLKLRVYEGIRQLILSSKLQAGQKQAERNLA